MSEPNGPIGLDPLHYPDVTAAGDLRTTVFVAISFGLEDFGDGTAGTDEGGHRDEGGNCDKHSHDPREEPREWWACRVPA